MTYIEYVIGAYAVFMATLIWDFFSPRLRIRRILRGVRMRAQREAARAAQPTSTELQR
ncbi:MAG: heme exporter protein CcmD [Lysobacter sp.]|nr:heme exporter protein CcmD [Lysobacter sp.]